MPSYYLDWNASAPLHPEVLRALPQWAQNLPSNPSSVHRSGRKVRIALEDAREQLAGLLRAASQEIIFVSGGTEACHLAVQQVLRFANPIVVCSLIEHAAVRSSLRQLEEKAKVRVRWVNPNSDGVVDVSVLLAAVQGSAKDEIVMPSQLAHMAILMHANNETGVLQPVAQATAACRQLGLSTLWFCDATQSVGKVDVDVQQLGVHFLACSGHKLGALKGCGALWHRKDLPLQPMICGGPQERELRAGTENVLGILSMGLAADLAAKEMPRWHNDVRQNRDHLEQALLAAWPGANVSGQNVPRLPNTLHLRFPGALSDMLLMALDMQGIEASAGSACSSGSVGASEILLAMGLSESEARSALRFSIGPWSASPSVETIANLLGNLRQAM